MGIYIKGMEMPKEIDPSIIIEFATGLSGKLFARYHDYNSGGSTEWHKVMTIQEPHGRLIDADKLHKDTYHRAFETGDDTMWQSGCWVRYRAIEQVQDSQQTIIEAEG